MTHVLVVILFIHCSLFSLCTTTSISFLNTHTTPSLYWYTASKLIVFMEYPLYNMYLYHVLLLNHVIRRSTLEITPHRLWVQNLPVVKCHETCSIRTAEEQNCEQQGQSPSDLNDHEKKIWWFLSYNHQFSLASWTSLRIPDTDEVLYMRVICNRGLNTDSCKW